jgi:hypothetical protein
VTIPTRWCAVCFNRPATNGVRCDDCATAYTPAAEQARAALNAALAGNEQDRDP